jgi:signal transduction histidine kinase
MARYIALAVVVSLVVSTVGIITYRFVTTRAAVESAARSFSALVSVPLYRSTEMYVDQGLTAPVEKQVRRLLQLNQDAKRLEIVRIDGSVAISASRDSVRFWPRGDSSPPVQPSGFRPTLNAEQQVASRVREKDETVYRVVVPFQDIDEPLLYAMVATFSYNSLYSETKRTVLVALFALALGLVITQRVSAVLASGITKNIDRLHVGVQRIRAGKLDEPVDVRSGDEIQELAEAFNEMSAELLETIGRLRTANSELQTLDQMKADLVANVSHELKTPLTALKGYLELLDRGDLGSLPSEARRAVSVCGRNVERLYLRIEELVDMSRMEKAWPDAASSKPVDLNVLIPSVAATLNQRMREKELRFYFESPPGMSTVAGNSDQLERAVLNLLDNGVKFTPRGGCIKVVAEECDNEGREGVLIRFSDTGVGIPKHQLVKVFDRFHQVDPSVRRRYGGMGLGLSLVQSIIDAHRGLVWAESENRQGSTFFVWLPCRPLGDDEAQLRAV